MQETRPAKISSGTPVRRLSDTRETIQKPKLLARLSNSLRSCHSSRRTEQSHCHQLKPFASLKHFPAMFQYSFGTHFVEDGYDIWTIQELLGYKDVSTTMIYTHVLNKGGHGVRSPMDWL